MDPSVLNVFIVNHFPSRTFVTKIKTATTIFCNAPENVADYTPVDNFNVQIVQRPSITSLQ